MKVATPPSSQRWQAGAGLALSQPGTEQAVGPARTLAGDA